ncbi:hypothetical protein HPG69_011164, partial [Diceros bicornis minor]
SKRKKQKRKKKQNIAAPTEPGSFSGPYGLHSLGNPAFQDAAPPQCGAQQNSPTSQPSQPPSTSVTPLEGGGHKGPLVPTEAGGRPLQGQAVGGAEAAVGGESLSSPAPQDQTLGGALLEGKDHHTPDPSKDRGLPQEGAVPTTSAGEGRPGKEDTAQEPRPAGQQAAAPASGEAETKDKTAVTGKKASETEKAKPEGNNRNYAAAVKNEEQRNQKAGAHEVTESPLSPGEGVTVYFHAIISRHFKFSPSYHKVFIRGGEEFGKPKWNLNVCEMSCTKDLGDDGFLVEGRAVLSKQHLNKPIPYKYVVARDKGPVEYEFIYKRQQKEGEHVNRCLHVRSSLLGSGDWHQYDDIICVKHPGNLQKLMDHVTDSTRKNLVRGKQIAARVMLDSIFSILQTWNAINLKNFFTQFQQFYSVVRVPMIYEGQALPWTALHYTETQVQKDLWKYLEDQMAPFLERSEAPLPEDCPVRSKLRMGLIVLFSVEKFNLSLLESDLTLLCNLLCSNASSLDAFHHDLSYIFGTSQSWQTHLVNLCRRCMSKRIDLWVCTLPVLHHCLELAPPGKDSGIQPEDTWAALEGMSFSQFREERPDQRQLLQLMGKRKHLLNVDEYLFRSWFSLLPLSNLVQYMEDFTDYLSHFPPRGLITGFKDLTKKSPPEIWRIFEEPLIQSYLTVCLKLHETVCGITKDQEFYEMPALSAEIVCRIIILKPLVDSAEGQGQETGKKNSVETVFQSTLTATRRWLQRIFKRNMFQSSNHSSVTFTYPEEIT